MSRPNWFIGLPVRAAELPAGILASLPAGIQRFHEQDLHVTVAFLGPVDERSARAAWSLADWSRLPALSAVTGPRAAFGNPRRPSAYGLDIHGAAVERFVARWRGPLLEAAGQPPDERVIRPHLTLGRPPRRLAGTMHGRARKWLQQEQPPASLRLDRLALYTRSGDRPRRRFTRVCECGFGAPGGAPREGESAR